MKRFVSVLLIFPLFGALSFLPIRAATAIGLQPVNVAALAVVVAQPPPTPRPEGERLLGDDFDDAETSALSVYGDEWMGWTVGDGVGLITSTSADNEVAVQYLAPAVADFILEVDLRIPSSETEGAGVIFRGSNLRERGDQDWHYYHIGLRPTEKVVELGLLLEGDTEVAALDTCKLPPSLSKMDDFRRLRVEATGAQLRVFVDGALICAMEDATLLAPGLVGLYVGVPEELSSQGEAVAEFARLRLYSLAIDDGDAETPAAEATPETVVTPEQVASPGGKIAKETTPEETYFEDDFSTQEGGWRTGENDNGSADYADGAFVIRNLTASPHRSESSTGIVAAHVVLEVDSWLVDGTDDNWQTLFCRQGDQAANFSASFSADGYYSAVARAGDETVAVQEPTPTDVVRQGIDAVNHARLSCVGPQIRFWVNDTLLVEWSDPSPAAGDFGLAVSALDGDYSEVAFDNFSATITGDDATAETAPPAEVVAPPALEAVVNAATLNVRSGPGARYARVGRVNAGDRLPVVDANAGCTWVKVVTPTTEGWVSTGYVTLTGDCGMGAPAATQTPSQPTPAATPEPAATSAAITPPSPMVANFETFGNWRRGDETWGEFSQSSEQVYAGDFAGKLTYNFPANIPDDRNYVVFLRSIPIAGEPDALEMAVYGDGSGGFLNVWVKDASSQVWQFSFGQINHTGWQRMTARLDTTLDWPVQPIGGNATRLVYPIALNALVFDYPTPNAASGALYFDDLQATYGE